MILKHTQNSRTSLVVLLPILIAFVLLLSGCATTISGSPADEYPADQWKGQLTKTDVIMKMGTPDNIVYRDGKGYLYFVSGKSEGMGVMLGNPVAFFLIANGETVSDTYIVEFNAADDRVTNVRPMTRSPRLERSIWPFGS